MISFAEKHPELVSEWAESNGDYRPDNVSYGSNQKITWIGKCGHEWEATVKNRGNGSGCPFCAGNQVLYGFNDLASANPELAAEWSELNYPLYPSAVTTKANRKVWWRCRNCGQHWQARIADRTEGHGCPVCSGEKLVAGINDFATEHPDLAEEWDSNNLDLKPSMVWSKSRRNVWWKCKTCGYRWRGVIDSRVKGQKCPACEDKAVHAGHNDLMTLYPELAKEWDDEKNRYLLPTMVSPKSRRSVYWRCPYDHVWSWPINERVEGAGCPICEENNKSEIMNRAIRYYADKADIELFEDDEEVIGIPIGLYFPKASMGIEICDASINKGNRRRWENGKNWLCLNSGIRLIRIMAPGTEEFDNCICIKRCDNSFESYNASVAAAFKFGGIQADVDIERDLSIIVKGGDG